ncbi:predicted protein [Naegleria gruberi]|uniref:Predicted protein n=1 Tax=Naegleria gruberi TaxID=5762 RepID=D2VQM6_NAEGR|nr:uncharacterized protein NAEGRDRAFT_71280 [Naegleria gruberi]EFC40974.1 predicted protein [Naegleria gruberi]|eukprot:XP_002673718.1 predicted protein [Naegleria gruberi strain NEG-M]
MNQIPMRALKIFAVAVIVLLALINNIPLVKGQCKNLVASMGDQLHCGETIISNLTFCSMMNGRYTDKAFFSKPIVTGNGTYSTYAEYMDKFLEDSFNSMQAYLLGKGVTSCPSCIEKLKYSYCANAFPKNGYISCVANNYLSYLAEIGKSCSGFCCANSGLCVIDSYGKSCQTKTLSIENYSLLTCIVPKLPDLFTKLGSCSEHFMNIDHCQTLLSTCDCSSDASSYKYTCSRFYSEDGFKFDNFGGSSTCTDTTAYPAWCPSGARSIETAMSEIRSKVLDFVAPVVQNTEQYVIPKDPLKANIAKSVQLGTPVPFYLPSLKTVSFEPPAASDVATLRSRIACTGEECATGCTNPKAYVYNPYAESDSGKCSVDPFYLLTVIAENGIYIAVGVSILVIVVCAVFACILGFCIFCCCCRDRAKMKMQGKRELLEKRDLKTNRLQKAADKILNKL